MPRKFHGSYEELQDRVLLTGELGHWRDLGNQKQFFSDNGAVLNWWESSHTLFMQGREPERTCFERSFWSWDEFATDAKRAPR
jgi:hypothetical protein